jgi:hypothetical protein
LVRSGVRSRGSNSVCAQQRSRSSSGYGRHIKQICCRHTAGLCRGVVAADRDLFLQPVSTVLCTTAVVAKGMLSAMQPVASLGQQSQRERATAERAHGRAQAIQSRLLRGTGDQSVPTSGPSASATLLLCSLTPPHIPFIHS